MKKKEVLNYFDELAESVVLSKECAIKLKNFILNFDRNKMQEVKQEIHEIENIADKRLQKIKEYLIKDFLPPIDREDILFTAHRIDDLVDGIDEIVINMSILNINNIENNMIKSIDLLIESTEMVHELVLKLKNLKKVEEIEQKIIEVNHIEELGDELYEKSIMQLYKNEKQDAIHIQKWTKIYEIIENYFDNCEKIADGIEGILMKNS